MRNAVPRSLALLLCTLFLGISSSWAADEPLHLVNKIPLGSVSGRIDHMSLDPVRHRLFVAELGNNSIGIVDLEHETVIKRLTGLDEPQGVAYVEVTDTLVVANGGDGSVRGFRGSDFTPIAQIDLKSDADNMRVDPATNRVWVGFKSGALAAIDTASMQKTAEISLKDHPEAFQIDPAHKRIFANVPDAHQIAVVDIESGRQTAAWDKLPARSNFPMAILGDGDRVAVAFRSPPRLAIFDAASGAPVVDVPTCGDADDVFEDARRKRLYVSCGEGAIDVFVLEKSGATPLARIKTSSGARTAVFDPEADRYYLAVRAGLVGRAEIWVYEPK